MGNNHILLGTADSLGTKFANLLVFYKKAMPQVVVGTGTKPLISNIQTRWWVLRAITSRKDSLKAIAREDSIKKLTDTSQIQN